MQTILKLYHCVYQMDKEENLVHSINVESTSMIEALKSFHAKFPYIEPLYVMCLTNLNNHEKNMAIPR
jgi:hypothetical protein